VIAEAEWAQEAGRARAGDRAALASLSAKIWPWVRRWALLELKDPALAEDAAQEALVRVIRHLGSWSADRPFAPWLHALVRNTARDLRARQGEVREAQDQGSGEPHLDRGLDLRRTADRALAAFDSCTPRQRQLLDLCDRQGLSPTEAAEMLGIAPGTARALLHQGRSVIRAEILRASGDEVLALLKGARHGV
jgi:RNA polymerase sigma-70 factor (ECF subfamily)